MFLANVVAARAECTDDSESALPTFVPIAGVALRAEPKIHSFANDGRVRCLAPRRLFAESAGLSRGQLDLFSLHAIMMALLRLGVKRLVA